MSTLIIHPIAPKKAVRPHECALLFGMPLTRIAFEQKLARPHDGSFSESYRARSLDLAWVGYRPMAAQLCLIADEAERLGVRVVRAMHLEDIASACDSAAVTIVSHWRSARFQPADLIDLDLISKNLMDCGEDRRPSDADSIANRLNLDFPQECPDAQSSLGAAIRYQQTLLSHRRLVMLRAPQAFCGGPGVEFWGGFEDIETISAQVPSSFKGVFDLTVCNSLLLAESLHLRAPRCLVLATSDRTYPETRLPIYLALLRLLATGRFAYEDAMNYIQEQLRKEFR